MVMSFMVEVGRVESKLAELVHLEKNAAKEWEVRGKLWFER